MYRVLLFTLIILSAWAGAEEAVSGITVYVAPAGNDGWSGSLPDADAAGAD